MSSLTLLGVNTAGTSLVINLYRACFVTTSLWVRHGSWWRPICGWPLGGIGVATRSKWWHQWLLLLPR